VFIVAALGWLFDCLDQQLFVLARPAAMKELLPPLDDPRAMAELVKIYGNYATSIFLAGWAIGGLMFGVLGDRIGRAKTMMLTILLYSICTGLSALSQGFWDFAAYRFLTGLGVGGEFAVGVALVAEVMPARARPHTLALLQALSSVGNVMAALINMGLGVAETQGLVSSPWRIMFLIGALPALLVLVIRRRLKEPDRWQRATHEGAVVHQLGSYAALFRHPTWRRNALVGLGLACAGVIGLWAVGFFTPDLMRAVQRQGVAQRVYDEQIELARQQGNATRGQQLESLRQWESNLRPGPLAGPLAQLNADIEPMINGRLAIWAGITMITMYVGGFLGMFAYGLIAERLGRRGALALSFLAAFGSTVSVFLFLDDFYDLFWLVPLMGFCQFSLFAGYAIYFPELFPTHLRSTGVSFCYNVGRLLAATGPLLQAELLKLFAGTDESLRYAGATMSVVFLVGLLILPFAPETRGKPLPE
jgi:MFS family permease